jgi:hypothetical protein
LRSSEDTCTDTVFGLMNSAVAMSRFDAPATTPDQDLAFPCSQAVEGRRGDRPDAAAAGNIADQRRQRGGFEPFCQPHRGGEFTGRGWTLG